jgi:hypothetical protein
MELRPLARDKAACGGVEPASVVPVHLVEGHLGPDGIRYLCSRVSLLPNEPL